MISKKLKSLSIFFPCYNDSGTIGSLVVLANRIAPEVADDYEIIVVDDGSRDSSRQLLFELKREIPGLKLVFHKKNQGYGGAIRSGFQASTKEWIFYTDGDNQYDVRELKRLVEHASDEIDVINGYKIERSDSLLRIVVGKIYHHTMRVVFGLHIRDVDCDFRLIRREVLDKFRLYFKSGVICVEMIKKMEKAGARFAFVPVQHHFRMHGTSQFFNFRRLFKVCLDIGRLWLHIFMPFGKTVVPKRSDIEVKQIIE